jgi:hypothetical protein
MQSEFHYLFRDFSFGLPMLLAVFVGVAGICRYDFFKRIVEAMQIVFQVRERIFRFRVSRKVSGITLAERIEEVHILVVAFMYLIFQHIVLSPWPNKSPEPTTIGAFRDSARVAGCWMSIVRGGSASDVRRNLP